jgi:hypothetical protein
LKEQNQARLKFVSSTRTLKQRTQTRSHTQLPTTYFGIHKEFLLVKGGKNKMQLAENAHSEYPNFCRTVCEVHWPSYLNELVFYQLI